MTKTVVSSYVKICFNYEKNINDWYTNLKQQVRTDEFFIKKKIQNFYKQAIRFLFKAFKDLES